MTSTTFNLDEVEAEATATTFDFTLKGHTFSLPWFGGLDYRALLEGDYDGDGNPTYTEMRRLLRLGLGEAWDTFDALPLSITGITAIFTRWEATAPSTVGESGASTGS